MNEPIIPSLRQLEAFVLTARLGSLTRAALAMHVTQSAVSVLIRQLEANFGQKLFDRTTRALHLTPAANEALAMAERILRETRHLTGTMRTLATRDAGRVRFAASAAVAASLMPRVLRAFRDRFPHIEIDMQDVSADQLVPRILDAEVEFSIGTIEPGDPDIALDTVITDRLSAICQKSARPTRRRELAWDETEGLPTVSIRRGNRIRTLIDEALARHGKSFTPRFEVSLLNTALAMTAHGLGPSILPRCLVPMMQYPDLVALPLRDPAVHRDLSIATRAGRSLSPSARQFIALAKTQIAAIGGLDA